MIQLILLLIAGIFLGAAAGILPGLHSNTLNSILLALNLPLEGNTLAVFIAAMACSRLAFEAIPSVLLFIPDENTVLSMLPGHRLALEGKSATALRVFAFSTLSSAALAVLLMPIALAVIPAAYSTLHPFTPFVLAIAILLMLLSENGERKLAAALCLLLSGALGIITLGAGLVDPFLPAFTGMFAVPAAIFALRSKTRTPPPSRAKEEFNSSQFLACIATGTLLGALADLFPGMGSAAQVALFASFLIPLDSALFLSLASSIASSHLLFSFAALHSIGKARTGAAAAVSSAIGEIDSTALILLAGTALISIAASSAIVFLFSRRIASEFNRLDHRSLNLVMLAFIPLLVFLLEGAQGTAVLLVASAVGTIPLLAGCKRIHLMGFIIVPAIAAALG